MKKWDELFYPSSCLNSAQDDEPIFVLRANDEIAPEVVEYWAMLSGFRQLHQSKVVDAVQCAIEMREWQQKHIRK